MTVKLFILLMVNRLAMYLSNGGTRFPSDGGKISWTVRDAMALKGFLDGDTGTKLIKVMHAKAFSTSLTGASRERVVAMCDMVKMIKGLVPPVAPVSLMELEGASVNGQPHDIIPDLDSDERRG